MNKNEFSAVTEADSNSTAQNQQVSQPNANTNVIGWHFLPELPDINKEVLVAVKYDNEPVQAYWTGKEWKGSFLVRDNMADGFVTDESFRHVQEWIYAWVELPQVPAIPEPF